MSFAMGPSFISEPLDLSPNSNIMSIDNFEDFYPSFFQLVLVFLGALFFNISLSICLYIWFSIKHYFIFIGTIFLIGFFFSGIILICIYWFFIFTYIVLKLDDIITIFKIFFFHHSVNQANGDFRLISYQKIIFKLRPKITLWILLFLIFCILLEKFINIISYSNDSEIWDYDPSYEYPHVPT